MQWYQKNSANHERYNRYQRQYYNEHKLEYAAYRQKSRLAQGITLRLRESINSRRRKQTLKKEVLTHYGNGRCACVVCGDERLACLSIDHINGRKLGESLSGTPFYYRLKREGYPKGYQTLCMNCQFVKKEEEMEYVYGQRWGESATIEEKKED